MTNDEVVHRDVDGPIVQAVLDPDIIDFGVGQPDPDLLPAAELRRVAAAVFDRYGPDVLGYGAPAGPPPAIAMIRDRLATTDGRVPSPDEVVVTAGNSHALDQVVTLFTRPGDAVLVESPTYHLALHILRDHRIELVPVPSDAAGMRTDALPGIVADLRRRDVPASLLYTVPTFNNPTGRSLPADRRRALVEFAATEGITVVEDDVYRELTYDGEAPPSLWSIGEPGTVIRLGSFSKSLAPGLRVGYLTADPATAARIVDGGVLDSGGGIGHLGSLVVAEYAADGSYAANVSRLRAAYRERRDALVVALRSAFGDDAAFAVPGGGYFVWLCARGLAGRRAEAEAAGVGFVPGRVFDADRADSDAIRLAFSRYPANVLAEGAARLATVARRA